MVTRSPNGASPAERPDRTREDLQSELDTRTRERDEARAVLVKLAGEKHDAGESVWDIDASPARWRPFREIVRKALAANLHARIVEQGPSAQSQPCADMGSDIPCSPVSLTPLESALSEALRVLYVETADYITVNKLGDIHHNASMCGARDALDLMPERRGTKRRTMWPAVAVKP